MRKMDGHIDNEEVRRICRAINNQAGHPAKLQTLVVRLQAVLKQEAPPRQEPYENRAAKMIRQAEDPFDKIMVV